MENVELHLISGSLDDYCDDDELDGNVSIGDCCCLNSVPNMFEYDHTLIPEEPNFFTAGYISSKEDK